MRGAGCSWRRVRLEERHAGAEVFARMLENLGGSGWAGRRCRKVA